MVPGSLSVGVCILVFMSMKLLLLDDSDHNWRIDEQTRQVGIQGIAEARDVLKRIPRRTGDDDPSDKPDARRQAA
jgi:hypothetical protein